MHIVSQVLFTLHQKFHGLVGWGYRLHWLHLCRGIGLPQMVQLAGDVDYTNCISACPVGWSCRIHWLLLCRGVRPPTNECPRYDTKQSDGEVPAMLELWGMQSTPSLPSLSGPLWPRVVAPDKGPVYGLNRTNSILMINWIVWVNWIAWNRNVFDTWTVLTFKLHAYA